MDNSKLFVTLFIATIIIGNPFVVKKLISKDNIEADIQESYFEEIDNEENILNNETNFQNIPQNEEQKVIFQKVKVDKEYFNDALFIGDSRTVGIAEYSNLKNATFFADTGMSVYNVLKNKVSIKSMGKVKLEKLLSSKKYGKVYIMLGINELGCNHNQNLKKYKEIIELIRNKQPDCIIYIEANLHVTAEKSKEDKVFNNSNINDFNNKIAKLANNNNVFYIDINQHFDDKDGNLRADYTHDKIHIFAKYYKEWGEWISSQAIVKQQQ